jgi:hypothetical protein
MFRESSRVSPNKSASPSHTGREARTGVYVRPVVQEAAYYSHSLRGERVDGSYETHCNTILREVEVATSFYSYSSGVSPPRVSSTRPQSRGISVAGRASRALNLKILPLKDSTL